MLNLGLVSKLPVRSRHLVAGIAAVSLWAGTAQGDVIQIDRTIDEAGSISAAEGGRYVQVGPDLSVGNQNSPFRFRAIYRFDLDPVTAPVQLAELQFKNLFQTSQLNALRGLLEEPRIAHLRVEILDADRGGVKIVAGTAPTPGPYPMGPDVQGAARLVTLVELGDFRGNTGGPTTDDETFTIDVTSFVEADRLADFSASTFRFTLVDQNNIEIDVAQAQAQVSRSATLLVTVPEPASLGLIGAGILAITLRRRR